MRRSSKTTRAARRGLSGILAIAALAAGAAGAAPPAAADTTATFSTSTGAARCETVWQYSVLYAWGAWGRYIDGCTVSVRCPYAAGCVFERAFGSLRHYTEQNTQVSTCNSRLQIFTAAGALRYSQDRSVRAYAWCSDTHNDVVLPPLAYNERATVQSNGVRNDIYGYASITSWIAMIDWAERCATFTRVYGC